MDVVCHQLSLKAHCSFSSSSCSCTSDRWVISQHPCCCIYVLVFWNQPRSYMSYVRFDWLHRCWFVRAELVWTEALTRTHTCGLCTADKIRSYPYTHTHTQTQTAVRPRSGTNTLVAQQREHFEPWTLQLRLALVTCAVDFVGNLLVPEHVGVMSVGINRSMALV